MSANIIKSKTDEFLNDRRKGNNIIDVLNFMKNDPNTIPCCVGALGKLFLKILERRDFSIDSNLKLTQPNVWQVENDYVIWLKGTYDKILEKFYELMKNDRKEIQEQVLATLMKLINKEKEYPINEKSDFPKERLGKVVRCLVSKTERTTDLITCYKNYLNKNILFNTWEVLALEASSVNGNKNDVFILNVLDLMENIVLKENKKEKGANPDKKLQKLMIRVWLTITGISVSPPVHRKLLISLLESYLPMFDNPIFFTDFFMSSINFGGANSLLALQGMLILIQKHNLECPNVYAKLYRMFEPEILHTKYKARLFYLADLFLTSTHLPGALVAAFVKRTARLALTAQSPDIVIILRFIGNLLMRHNVLIKMIHNSEVEEVPEDPFIMEEPEPMKSRAIESSLWEISLLKNHVQPTVAIAAKFIDTNLPSVEYDLSEVLDVTCKDVFLTELKKNNRSLTFFRPQAGIVKLTDDHLFKMWDLT